MHLTISSFFHLLTEFQTNVRENLYSSTSTKCLHCVNDTAILDQTLQTKHQSKLLPPTLYDPAHRI